MSEIVGKLGFRYRTDIVRADAKWREELNQFSAANLSDGLNKLYTMDCGIRRMFPAHKMIGTAVTVKVRSGDNYMLHKAMDLVEPGDVLVVETQGCCTYAVAGEIMVTCMDKLGVAGLVVDGTVRDIKELAEIGMPIYARGTVCGAGDKDGPGEVNFPVSCGGVVVEPGDYIIGDADGVVVVPKDDVEEAIKWAAKKVANEVKRHEQIEGGQYRKPGLDALILNAAK